MYFKNIDCKVTCLQELVAKQNIFPFKHSSPQGLLESSQDPFPSPMKSSILIKGWLWLENRLTTCFQTRWIYHCPHTYPKSRTIPSNTWTFSIASSRFALTLVWFRTEVSIVTITRFRHICIPGLGITVACKLGE